MMTHGYDSYYSRMTHYLFSPHFFSLHAHALFFIGRVQRLNSNPLDRSGRPARPVCLVRWRFTEIFTLYRLYYSHSHYSFFFQSSCLLKAPRVVGQRCNEIFQKQKHHHKSDKHHHKRDYHKTKGNEVITEQEEIENKHNIKHNQSSQLMMSKFNLSNYKMGCIFPIVVVTM